MIDAPLKLLAGLLEAIGDVHTPRAMARAIAIALENHTAIVRVVIGAPAPIAIVERSTDGWRASESSTAVTTPLVPGLAITSRGPLPAFFAEAAFRTALERVIETGLRHLAVVQRVAELSRRAHVTSRQLREDLDRIASVPAVVARSAPMRAVLERASLVARHSTTVLLTGESGTGKEVLAREIHRMSPRAHRPMLQLNCGAIPEALIESELFGYERGAFTGADRAHAGVFERAHRGTLLLDEVGELPLSAQVKLLRVIQERQVRRVGGVDQIDVDARLIAATNRSLSTMVRDGAFREDLYYRLNVFAIALPPLRERRGDLGPLVQQLLGDLSAKLGLPAPTMSRAVMARLDTHDWPGNVRELANVLEAALILSGGDTLELPHDFVHSSPRRHRRGGSDSDFNAAVRDAIEVALRATRGKIYGADGAAAQLGLKPGTLQSKMRKLGIDRSAFIR